MITQIKSLAKINLYLHIIKKLPSGYHELDSLVMFCEDLYDIIEIEEHSQNEIITIGPYSNEISGENLLDKVLKTLSPYLKNLNFKITLTKNIPVGAGLGGGSSNAGTLLKFLTDKYIPNFKLNMLNLATEIGADVPIFLNTKASYVNGIGEKVTQIDVPLLYAILVYPNEHISTKQVFENSLIPHNLYIKYKYKFEDAQNFCEYVRSQSNDLLPNALKIFYKLSDLIEKIANLPECQIARMSGSGSTCFGIFTSYNAALNGYNIFMKEYPNYFIIITDLV